MSERVLTMIRRSAGGQSFHRVERVHDQIEQDLLNLNGRRFDLGQLRIEFGRDDCFAEQRIRANQSHRVGNDGVKTKERMVDALCPC